MKQFKEYIIESASLFDNGGYNDIPQNYLEYNEGDQKFGELQNGDKIYVYSYSNENLIEVTIKGYIENKNRIYIKTESYKLNPNSKYCKTSNKLEIGPTSGGRTGADDEGIVRDYSPNKAKDSSICVSFGNGYAFGTNKENVLKYAKSDISNSINKIQNDIEKLQNQIEALNKKLENIK